MSNVKVFEKAKAVGEKFLEAIKWDGIKHPDIIKREVGKITHEGNPVHVEYADNYLEAYDAVERGVRHLCGDKAGEVLKEIDPDRCIWDYYLIAFYEAVYSELPTKDIEFMKVSLLEACRAGLSHLILLGDLIVAVGRPEAHRDERIRLHRANGPAIVWGDKKYWWHGVQVPQQWIEFPETLGKKDWQEIKNQELRRAFCEILGWNKVLDMVGAKKIQSDDWGNLVETQLEDDDGRPARFADVTCPSTGRRYLLRTTPEETTCRGALARSAKITPEEYEFTEES